MCLVRTWVIEHADGCPVVLGVCAKRKRGVGARRVGGGRADACATPATGSQMAVISKNIRHRTIFDGKNTIYYMIDYQINDKYQ
jgi:hypothetical protein